MAQYEVILTQTDLPSGCNPPLLIYDASAALSYQVCGVARMTGITVIEITLTRQDEGAFNSTDLGIIDGVVATHDPYGQTEEQEIDSAAQAIYSIAGPAALGLPNFFGWTTTEAMDWIDEHGTDVPGLKIIAKKQAKAFCVLRNYCMPWVVATHQYEE